MFSIALTIVVTNEKGVDSSYPTSKLCAHTCPENWFGPTLSADKELCLVFIKGHSTTTWTEFCHNFFCNINPFWLYNTVNSRFKKVQFSFLKSRVVWSKKYLCSESKNQSSKKNALCRWICNLRSFLNREFTVLMRVTN